MKISIITPSYNQAKFIERTILSVLSQNHPNLEYIVIDGGSTDGTIEILKKYSDKIIWKSEKDNGQSDAINKGFKIATGDIIAYLNSDDTYESETLRKVTDFFQKNLTKKWVYGKCKIINEKDQEIRKPITWYKNLLLKNYSYKKLLTENFISQPATFWKKEILNEIGNFNTTENFCMDYEFWLRIGQKYPAGIINSYLANFRYYINSKSGSVNKKQFQDELRLAKKYGTAYPLSIFLHQINYYKITGIYKILNMFNKIYSKIETMLRLLYRKFMFLIKTITGNEIYFPIQSRNINKKYLGSQKYGGWFICPDKINKNSIIYSFGVGEDVSFDLDIIRKFNCNVFAFDPTPKSITWLKKQTLPKKFSYFKYGIGATDGFIQLFPPINPNHISHSIFQKDSQNSIKAKIAKLKTIMHNLGHNRISILKMDIEGSEYDVINDILKSNLEIDQILVEFHHRFSQISPQRTKRAIKKLNKAGYKIFSISSSREEYSFIKLK